jgi:hypothetical protein
MNELNRQNLLPQGKVLMFRQKLWAALLPQGPGEKQTPPTDVLFEI